MGSVRADRVIVATNAYPSPVRASRRRIIPVYDHVLMTEPLTDEQQASIGWSRWEGIDEAASRFGAQVALDLADGVETERTELKMVRSKPFPFPPEPLRSAVVGITKKSIQRADERQGREDVWLKFLSRLGIGFDT
jgi:hypothetical protein